MISMKLYPTLSLLMIFTLGINLSSAQNGSQKYVGDRLEDFTDSLKNTNYPYIFPAWGAKVIEKGFDIPLPHGVMVNAVRSLQSIKLENLAVGFNGGELIDISDFVRFRSVEADAQAINLRPDTWVLPFLNVYGLLGYVQSDTEVNIGLPIDLQANSQTQGPYYGLGFLVAGGVGPLWFSFDYNQAWVKTDVLDKATRARINGIRLGHTWVFRKRPEQNVAFWIGGQFQKLGSETQGSVRISDVIDVPTGEEGSIAGDLTQWFEGLSPTEQEIFQPVYDRFLDFLNGLSDTTVSYRFNKKLANPWSLALGAQWQINKVWQIRSEYNFLGSREQFMLSANWRFGLKGLNFLSAERKAARKKAIGF